MDHRVILGILYTALFTVFACMRYALQMVFWALSRHGPWAMGGAAALYLGTLAGLVYCINAVNGAWPALYLPPEATTPEATAVELYQTSEQTLRSELEDIDMPSANRSPTSTS